MAPPHIFAGACVNCALSAFTASASCMNASFSWVRQVLFCVVTFFLRCGAVSSSGIFSKDFERFFVVLWTFLR